MRTLILFGLILLLLTLNSGATTPLPLSGPSGKAILTQVASTNITNEVTKATVEDLWSWGKIPLNYALNQSGKLSELASGPDEDNLWLNSRKNEINELNISDFD